MNRKRASDSINLTSFDDLFGESAEGEQIIEVSLRELHEFRNHPFKVLDDEKMEETVASVKEHGIIVPGIVRPRKESSCGEKRGNKGTPGKKQGEGDSPCIELRYYMCKHIDRGSHMAAP